METGVSKRKSDPVFFKYGIYFAFALLAVVLAVVSPPFRTLSNIENILQQTSVNGIMAVGMTLVIITAGIDLSVGSVLALSAVVATSFAHPGAHSLVVPVAIGIVVGLACGTVNGILIAKKRLAPFIVTLGMMTVARGLALVYTNGRPVINLSDAYNEIGGGYLARHSVSDHHFFHRDSAGRFHFTFHPLWPVCLCRRRKRTGRQSFGQSTPTGF